MSAPTRLVAWQICTATPGAGSQWMRLYETTDGGRTWTRLSLRAAEGFGYASGLTMTAAGDGIFTMHRGMSWVTRDGGRHWRTLRSITAPDAREGFSATQLSARTALIFVFSGDTGTTLYRTVDGDRTWRPVRRWPPP